MPNLTSHPCTWPALLVFQVFSELFLPCFPKTKLGAIPVYSHSPLYTPGDTLHHTAIDLYYYSTVY